MTTNFRDALAFEEPVTFNNTVDLSDATVTYPTATLGSTITGQRPVQYFEIPFVRADILAGSMEYTGLPQNIKVLGVHVVMTTPLAFSAGTTTGVSAKIGNSIDDDALGLTTALAGVAGYRRPVPGAQVGGVMAGGSDGLLLTFTATGGTPVLAEVSAGAGKLVIDFLEV